MNSVPGVMQLESNLKQWNLCITDTFGTGYSGTSDKGHSE